ncbi:hypothetical protein E3N88_14281 [Mikania micrantha]|uniref:Uncharacterized protein n=1 Tax=Mikania micrantha TaxID=192012 RepID=A0A5N6P2Q2_9ASTR|nr:hypothetical protein E3N88_14281 [Mikania micrantha]
MGEMYQKGKNKQMGKTVVTQKHQEHNDKKSDQSMSSSKTNGESTSKASRQQRIHLNNQFEVLEEDDLILDLEESICKGELVAGGRVHRNDPQGYKQVVMEEVESEEETIDYGITDAQKWAITSRLIKFKSVRASDQDAGEQGEWDFFHDHVKELNIDPRYCVEDVELDDTSV